MKYEFNYEVKAFDIWRLAMYDIYGTREGVHNIIFTVGLGLAAVKFWGSINKLARLVLVSAISLIGVFQPIDTYRRAREQTNVIPQDVEMKVEDTGVHMKAKGKRFKLGWNKIRRIFKKPGMLVMRTEKGDIIILPNRVLGKEKEEFYDYMLSKIEG